MGVHSSIELSFPQDSGFDIEEDVARKIPKQIDAIRNISPFWNRR
jgi:hypothetical protein